jgi:hypothetical protein
MMASTLPVSLPVLISLGEAVVLFAVVIALLRLRQRVRRLGADPTESQAQMRALIAEAQTLSGAIAGQLTERAYGLEQVASVVRKPAAERAAGARAIVARPAAPVEPEAHREADREAARARGMDPIGLTLQRTLQMPARPAS